MEVRIDYDTELIYTEKKKIRWLVEEFDIQFGIKNAMNKITSIQKKVAIELLDNIMENVDVKEPDVLEYFQNQMEVVEKKYPFLFN